MSDRGGESEGSAPPRPPKLPFVLTIGVTGHRQAALDSGSSAGLADRLRGALRTLLDGAQAVREQEAAFYADGPARLRFISPLADGADQLAAEIALELGFELIAILPFGAERYRDELADEASRERFDLLLQRATCTLSLPGESGKSVDAYVMTGRATIAHCDLLLAVWDGHPPRGRGGTGEVVELAVVKGTPVVHLPLADELPARMLWSGYDPTVVTARVEDSTERPFDAKNLALALSAFFAPPADLQERKFLATFAGEHLRRHQFRVEYPLLLAAARVARFDRRKLRADHYDGQVRLEWATYRRDCANANAITAPLQLLEESYRWSDQLAAHFAQTYRSGHIFNFLFGSLAVCLGLAANAINHALFELALVEGVVTILILLNTHIGVKNEWHRRWLDYRQLAERLRPMRSLKLLGIAAPDPPGTRANPVPRRWIDWYALGIWRAMGCPAGSISAANETGLARAVARYEVAPQVAYHERHAHQIELLDERLGRIAGSLFLATLAASAAVVFGLLLMPDFINAYDPWFTIVEAGFPALGTAVFGIRFQADFGGSAVRSQATANALRPIAAELDGDCRLMRTADLTEEAARIMLADLDEWRLVNQQQDLDLA